MRQSLRAMTHGVYVLSVHHDGMDDYIIVALAMQCSVQPPRVAFAVAPGARLIQALRAVRGALLAVVDSSQHSAVRRYGVPGGVKHLPQTPARDAHNHPIPPEASHWLSLENIAEIEVGDHLLFVANVTDAGILPAMFGASMTLAGSGFPYAG